MKLSILHIARLLTLILWLIGLPPAAHAQAPAWQVAMTGTNVGNNTYNVYTMTTNAAGDLYLTGDFTGAVTLGNTILTSAGDRDIFIAKWSTTTSAFVWALRAGGNDLDYPGAITSIGSSIYIGGSFRGSAASFGNNVLSANGQNEVFVAKLTDSGSTGNFVWARQAGGAGTETVQSIAVNGTSIYLAGYFFGASASFGAITLPTVGGSDLYVAKLTDIGSIASFMWAQGIGSTGNESTVVLTANGPDLYIAGSFLGPSISIGNSTLMNVSNCNCYDTFVTKLTDVGTTSTFAWARAIGGTTAEEPRAIAVNGSNVYVAVDFNTQALSIGSTVLLNRGGSDIAVAKLIDGGTSASFGWALQGGGSDLDLSYRLMVDGSSVYLGGWYVSPLATFGNTTVAAPGGSEQLFVSKLTDAGNNAYFEWTQTAGGPYGGATVRGLVKVGNQLFISGGIYGPATFGPQTIPLPVGRAVSFLASFDEASVVPTFTRFSPASGPVGTMVSITGANFTAVSAVTFNGVPAAGFTLLSPTQLAVPVPVGAGSGTIRVVMNNGTATTATPFIVQTATTILAANSTTFITCYPNPAHSQLTLKLSAVGESATAAIVDALGHTARTYAVPARATSATLDLTGLAPGLYVVRCGAASGKLVVE